jgi:hypothetical protein
MSKRFWIAADFAVVAAAGWPLLDVAVAQTLPPAAPAHNLSEIKPLPGAPNLNPTSRGRTAHIMPTVQGARALAKARALAPFAGGPLVYHAGGSIMPRAKLYAIFWIPAALQNGGSTVMPVAYQNLQTRLLADYTAHGIDNNNTQYYQILGSTTTYIQNAAGVILTNGFAGSFVDNSPYPNSGCTDTFTPGNCITDAQIQAEIQKVISLAGWTSGRNKMFLLYTSSGEGSCMPTPTGPVCAYTDYCAYHSFIGTSPPIIYANMPFGNLSTCQLSGTPSPNGDALADAVASIATHEITESITDPLGNAWFRDSDLLEIGDICNFDYGTNTWDAGLANQQWNGHFYEVQQEFNNHTNTCVQMGP